MLSENNPSCLKIPQIRLYDDHLEIWNPGNLPPGLTPEALFHEHDSIPRNRRIADAFFYSGLIERWGSAAWPRTRCGAASRAQECET